MLLLTHRYQESPGNHGRIKNDIWEGRKRIPLDRAAGLIESLCIV